MLSLVLFAIIVELLVSLWGGWLKQETGIDLNAAPGEAANTSCFSRQLTKPVESSHKLGILSVSRLVFFEEKTLHKKLTSQCGVVCQQALQAGSCVSLCLRQGDRKTIRETVGLAVSRRAE